MRSSLKVSVTSNKRQSSLGLTNSPLLSRLSTVNVVANFRKRGAAPKALGSGTVVGSLLGHRFLLLGYIIVLLLTIENNYLQCKHPNRVRLVKSSCNITIYKLVVILRSLDVIDKRKWKALCDFYAGM